MQRALQKPSRRQAAVQAALAYLASQSLDRRYTRDGHPVGVQPLLVPETTGGLEGGAPWALALYDLLDGMVANENAGGLLGADPAHDLWRVIRTEIESKLGFSLEPELFSNMLFAAVLGGSRALPASLLEHILQTFRDRHLNGLYHFFLSPTFAGDIDCTAVAARARLVSGDIDPSSQTGQAELRAITSRILGSAATGSMTAEENRSHGKDNGPLTRHVFKVYLDDHELQDASADRGLKNNPVVVANALYPVLLEIALGLRSKDELVTLKEYAAGSDVPRTGAATVGEIVEANLAYVMEHLMSDAFHEGCRYYRSPDMFLWALSESVRAFPEVFERFGACAALARAVQERRGSGDRDFAKSPVESANLAMRAIAAGNVDADPTPELELLCDIQGADGSWSPAGSLFTFGSGAVPIHFSSPVVTAALAIRAFSGPPRRKAAPSRSGVRLRVST